jgi:hypothetical protein
MMTRVSVNVDPGIIHFYLRNYIYIWVHCCMGPKTCCSYCKFLGIVITVSFKCLYQNITLIMVYGIVSCFEYWFRTFVKIYPVLVYFFFKYWYRMCNTSTVYYIVIPVP